MQKEKEIFYFERGAYFAGMLSYKIEMRDDKYIFMGQASNDFCWMQEPEFELSESELEKLQSLLEPVLKWESNYETEDEIYDGYGWSIHFQYKDILIKTGGYEKYPSNYRKVIKKLQLFIEELAEKYMPDYQREGREERLKL